MPNAAPGLAADLQAAAGDIKLAHSVFALPFALLASFLARDPQRPWSAFLIPLALITLCMVLARTWAMLINRLADARFDARNPRTARRAIPAGRLNPLRAAQIAGLCAGAFLLACLAFLFFFDNPWPPLLGTPVLLWLAFYSFAKRFTWWCHLLLGSALGIAPLAAAIALNPATLLAQPSLWLLALMVTLWVAGFDVIYALQDYAFDRATGLHSIPVRFGISGAINISRGMHLLAIAALAGAILLEPRFGPIMLAALALTLALLIIEHTALARAARLGKPGLEMQWFTINGLIALALGAAGIADVLL